MTSRGRITIAGEIVLNFGKNWRMAMPRKNLGRNYEEGEFIFP